MTTEKEPELREQDKWLPIANVYRIMKNALPKNAKVSKEAKECVQECVSEFVSFITSEASEKCAAERRKTVNGEDILFAMTSLGFENYSEVLKIYLTKYREYLATKDKGKRSGSINSANTSSNHLLGDAAGHTQHEDVSSVGSVAGGEELTLDGDDVDLEHRDSYSYSSFDETTGNEVIYEQYTDDFTNVDMAEFAGNDESN